MVVVVVMMMLFRHKPQITQIKIYKRDYLRMLTTRAAMETRMEVAEIQRVVD